jgi:hypothetical protein
LDLQYISQKIANDIADDDNLKEFAENFDNDPAELFVFAAYGHMPGSFVPLENNMVRLARLAD